MTHFSAIRQSDAFKIVINFHSIEKPFIQKNCDSQTHKSSTCWVEKYFKILKNLNYSVVDLTWTRHSILALKLEPINHTHCQSKNLNNLLIVWQNFHFLSNQRSTHFTVYFTVWLSDSISDYIFQCFVFTRSQPAVRIVTMVTTMLPQRRHTTHTSPSTHLNIVHCLSQWLTESCDTTHSLWITFEMQKYSPI